MIFQVLTLWQPWASLLVTGIKKYETRSWDLHQRGLLLIHAAKAKTEVGEAVWHAQQIYKHPQFAGMRFDQLPFGRIVGSVIVTDSTPTVELLEADKISRTEFALGDYSPDRFGIRCIEPRRFDVPVPATGRQKLWNFNDESSPLLRDQMKLAPRFGVVDVDECDLIEPTDIGAADRVSQVLDEIAAVHV